MNKSIFCIIIFAGLLSSCSNGSSSSSISGFCSSGLTNGIVGGDLVTANTALSQSVVFIFHRTSDDGGTGCTGTLISNDVILTAAHCVEGATNYQKEIGAFFTVNPRCDASLGTLQRIDVQDVIQHPDYRSGVRNSDGDLALIKLKKPAPAGYVPMRVADHYSELTSLDSVTVVGYGQTSIYGENDPNQDPDLRLRTTQLHPIDSSMKSELGLGSYYKNTDDQKNIYFDQSQGHGVCHGDSGGPAFLNQDGENVLIGVAKAVGNPIEHLKQCGYLGIHSNAVYYRSWIMTNMRNLESEN